MAKKEVHFQFPHPGYLESSVADQTEADMLWVVIKRFGVIWWSGGGEVNYMQTKKISLFEYISLNTHRNT